MNVRSAVALAAAAATLAACGGGGGSSGTAAAVAPAGPSSATGTIPMSITIPRKPGSSAARTPQFFSPSAGALAIYDGATLVYVANLALDSTPPFQTVYAKSGGTTVTFGTCSFTSAEATCNLTLTATTGAHAFDLIVYPQSQAQGTGGAAPTFTGVISSEGELSVNLSPGNNPAQTLTLLGVADQVLYAGLSEAAYQDTVTYGFRIEDSTNQQIVQPGTAYDNGPVTITASPAGIVTITPSSMATPPATSGDQNFDVQCTNTAGGNVTISFNTQTKPNTAYASALTYSASNYSGATIATIPFTCDPATGTIPVTIQSKGHR